MQRNTYLEVMFPLIRLKHRLLESLRSPQLTMRPGDPQHEAWWSMQAAYYNYLFRSKATEAIAWRHIEDEHTHLAISIAEQLKAFEDYIDARFKYSEFHLEQEHRIAGWDICVERTPHVTERLRLGKWILAAVQTFLAVTEGWQRVLHRRSLR